MEDCFEVVIGSHKDASPMQGELTCHLTRGETERLHCAQSHGHLCLQACMMVPAPSSCQRA